jgi:hypothetical protein
MSVSFDPDHEALRLDADAFVSLAEYASDPAGACEELVDDFVRAGVVADGRPHPILREALAAVTSARCSLQVLVSAPGGVWLHHGWLAARCAMLTDLGDGTYDFAAVGTEFAPTSIARLTVLRARPRLDAATAPIDEALLDDLASSSAGGRAAAADRLARLLTPWPEARAAVRSGGWHLAVVDVTHPAGGRTVASRLAWVGTDAGTLRVEVDGDELVLVPASTTDIWRSVVAILPLAPAPDALGRSA